MIDVKLIKKPKNNGTSSDSGIATNGNGYNAGGVTKKLRTRRVLIWLYTPKEPVKQMRPYTRRKPTTLN